MKKTMGIYQSRHNPNKYIEIVHYSCGHYAVAQFIQGTNPITGPNTVYTGAKKGNRHLQRWRLRDINQFLSDYRYIGK